MTDRLEIKGIEILARHGVLPEEHVTDQPFLVDLVLEADLSEPGSTDALADTIDYGVLANRVYQLATGNRFNLIERLATAIADLCLENALVDRAVVTVHKPEAPIEVPFADVAVVVVRSR